MMRSITKSTACVTVLLGLGAGSSVWAQKWELGAVAGGGFYTNGSVTSPTGSGDVGFKPGPIVGAFISNNTSNRWGGELRYEFQPGNLKVSGSGSEATFSGEAHQVHYDFLFHFAPMEAKVRPFVAFGGGVKLFRGTGAATVTQNLSNLALLTNTYEVAGMGSVGAGLKFALSRKLGFRLEVRDFITPVPKQVLAPAPDASISGFLNDFAVMGGIAYTF